MNSGFEICPANCTSSSFWPPPSAEDCCGDFRPTPGSFLRPDHRSSQRVRGRVDFAWRRRWQQVRLHEVEDHKLEFLFVRRRFEIDVEGEEVAVEAAGFLCRESGRGIELLRCPSGHFTCLDPGGTERDEIVLGGWLADPEPGEAALFRLHIGDGSFDADVPLPQLLLRIPDGLISTAPTADHAP
jgi:hypothetical protein